MGSVRQVCVGGSDAGIAAALRALDLEPTAEVTVVLADAYPNFSICGLPYAISGEVAHCRDLTHRTIAELEATGIQLRQNTVARSIEVAGHRLRITTPDGREDALTYDPHARPIPQGPYRPVEFGSKAQVVDNDDGMVVDVRPPTQPTDFRRAK